MRSLGPSLVGSQHICVHDSDLQAVHAYQPTFGTTRQTFLAGVYRQMRKTIIMDYASFTQPLYEKGHRTNVILHYAVKDLL